jgi:hypothetical protein
MFFQIGKLYREQIDVLQSGDKFGKVLQILQSDA